MITIPRTKEINVDLLRAELPNPNLYNDAKYRVPFLIEPAPVIESLAYDKRHLAEFSKRWDDDNKTYYWQYDGLVN